MQRRQLWVTPIILKKKGKWYPKKIEEKAKYIMQILFTENTSHNGNGNQNRQVKNTRIDYTKYGKHNVDIIREPNQKIFKYGMDPKRSKINLTCHNRIKTQIFGIN